MLNAAKAKETIQVPPEPAESEYVFPPWPEGLPPPPPLPPASLPGKVIPSVIYIIKHFAVYNVGMSFKMDGKWQ